MTNKPTERSPKPGAGRVQALLVAVLFTGPLIAAGLLYYGKGGWQPAGLTNKGMLLSPVVSLLEDASGSTSARSQIFKRHWTLVYLHQGPCADNCQTALVKMRQVRLMLANRMNRLNRVFLHDQSTLDRDYFSREHDGLNTLVDPDLSRMIATSLPVSTPLDGHFLVDPVGNLVMYFPPQLEPAAMLDDLQQLLKLSRIG